jgi:lipopolysaccharide export system protein LptA
MKPFSPIILVLLITFLATVPAQAASDSFSGQPIVIKSNELQADTKNRSAIFSGKVIAKQGDITIHADRLVVKYAEKGGSVDAVEASGNVKIVQENRIGTAQRAVYYNNQGKIIMTGSPKVVQGKDVVTGKEVVYFVNEEKSLVTGGAGEPVTAVIYPKAKDGDGAKKP